MAAGALAEFIADYALGVDFSSLPIPVVHEAKRRFIDSLGCALGAFGSEPARIARHGAPLVAQGPSCGIIATGLSTTPDYAAFANGVMMRYLDYNDTYLSKEPAHPSDNIAAALAAAECSGSGGAGLIAAIVLAYEIQCALCDAASIRSRGWDHVTYGAFSATVAAARLLGLSRAEFIHAIGLSGTTSAALRQTRAGELSMWKGCAFANASRNALFFTMLAKGGMTGPSPVFEGEFGFEKLVSGPLKLGTLAAPGGPGHFKILDTYIKYYPAEYHAQSAIGAALELFDEIEDVESIESITIHTFRAAYEIIGSGREKWRPKTRETADHSLPFCVASALLDGDFTVNTFLDEHLRDGRLQKLMDRIKIAVDPELDKLYPEAMPTRLEVTLSSRKTLSKEMIYPKGHPKNPLTDAEVEDKFRNLSGWYFTDTEAGTSLARLWRLEEAKDMGDFMSHFNKGKAL